jgi:rod shape-determining protein MreC
MLFLLLEAIAITLLVRSSNFQRSKLVGLNREVSGYLYSKIEGAREYLSLKQVNEQLALENLELRNRLDQLSVLLDSSTVITEYAEPYHYYYVPARVVHNSVYRQYNYITLNKGKKDGVFSDMGVISDLGLVGIVYESSNNFSTVLPIINRDFRLSVQIKSNQYAGILQWEGDSPLYAMLTEIPFHVDIQEGDTIVTSGFSSIFPEGILVGEIESFSLEQGNFYDIRIRLSNDFQRLFHVNIIRNFRQEEQLNLENQLR